MAAQALAMNQGENNQRHTREGSRLMFSSNGLVGVYSSIGHWVVPPFVVLRLGPGVSYRVHSLDSIHPCDIAIPPTLNRKLAQSYGLYRMTPLLRELLHSFHEHPELLPDDSRSTLTLELLQKMKRWDHCTVYPQELINPKDKRVALICDHVRRNLDSRKKLTQWADELRLDPRTLHRLFVSAFGIPFLQWRQQIRIMAALKWLREGRPIVDIAFDLGYTSQSAFTAMFRRNVGITPTTWQENYLDIHGGRY
ncbi:MAG TPA: helix-turn-helix transcriptional regulator [Burkholderiaceae bacterium]|nr:helix-turn-helix transcriptional regulator [Burkholderiaceae bacterium]